MNVYSKKHKPINLGIVGYGKMGQEVVKQATRKNHTIAFIVDPSNPVSDFKTLNELGDSISTADVIVEFSLPNVVLENAKIYAKKNISAVVGTTGWDNIEKDIKKIIEYSNIRYIYGGNFSIGAHLFMKIAKYAASLYNKIPEYDVSLLESHHIQKKDRPSGTAFMTAALVLQELDEKNAIELNLPVDKAPNPKLLSIVSQRVGHELGFHELVADSPFDTIKVSHRARTREGFALGAVAASEWLIAQTPIHTHNSIQQFITIHEVIENWLQG